MTFPSIGETRSPVTTNSDNEVFERRDATEEEIRSLPHVVDKIPVTVWVAESIGAAERFTYYGITAPWRTFGYRRDEAVC